MPARSGDARFLFEAWTRVERVCNSDIGAQGMLFAQGDVLPLPSHVIRLYAHEATRVYRDKLVNYEDQRTFDRLLLEALRKNIPARLTAA